MGGPQPEMGYVAVPLNSGDVRDFKKEMGSLLEDPLGVAERVDQFLETQCVHLGGDTVYIRDFIYIRKERND